MPGGARRRVVFSICSANYVAYARTLEQSLAEAGVEAEFVLYLADEAKARFDAPLLGFPIVEARELDCPNLYDMAARYTILEFNTAIKPFCFRHAFDVLGADEAVYLDPDILAVSDFAELWRRLEDEAVSIVLTPHGTAPLDADGRPDDLQIMRAGAFNLGFCALRRSPPADAFVKWWGDHLVGRCVVDTANGLFVDQKFCDLAPGYFDGVHVFRHPGYNAAYWNLPSRRLTYDAATGWRAGGAPLRFFHFSGVDPADPKVFSRHQDRYAVEDLGGERALLERYLKSLARNAEIDGVRFASLSYAYGRLENSLPFTDAMRRVYRATHPPAARTRDEAFSGDLAPFLALAPETKASRSAPVTRLMQAIWEARDDLKDAFDLRCAEGRTAYARWFEANAAEHATPPAIIEATASLRALGDDTITSPGFRAGGDRTKNPAAWAARRSPAPAFAPGLALFGYFRSETGLGAAVRAQYRAVREVGLAASAHELIGGAPAVDAGVPLERAVPKYDCVLLHMNADETLQVETRVDPRALLGRHRIGYWAWELETFPLEWTGAFDKVDEVWCPSAFTARALSERTEKPVTVVPHAVAVPPLRRDVNADRAAFGLPASAIIFLAACDADSFVSRKNPAAAVRAFLRAFPSRRDDVCLVLKLRRGTRPPDADWRALLRLAATDPRILIIEAVLTRGEIDALQSCCDVFVSLHRSEGFGLWIAECMARGKPCVVTDYSGSRDFADASNAVPVAMTLTPVGRGRYPYGEGRLWAAPDEEAAAAALRALAEDAALRRRLGEAARITIEELLSPAAVGAQIATRLNRARAEIFELPTLVAA